MKRRTHVASNNAAANTKSDSAHSEESTFKRTKGAAGMEGQICEIYLSMLFLLKATTDERVSNFYLASNMAKADKFDDIVFKYENVDGVNTKSKVIFLQAKHKIDPKKVQIDSLLTNSESGEFSLKKYFISYRKIKRQFSKGKGPIFNDNFEDSEFIIYTNAPMKVSNSITEEDINRNEFLRISDSQCKYYQLAFNTNRKGDILSLLIDSSDSRRLSKELVHSITSAAGIDMQKDIFQKYHMAIQGKVVERFSGKLEGRLCETFLNHDESLSTDAQEFRRYFLEEAEKIFKKRGNELTEELQKKVIKLSYKFGVSNSNPDKCTLSLPNDPVTEEEIKGFLNNFKLYAGQLDENELEIAIKDKVKEVYRLEANDVNLIFSDVQNKVQKWWKQENKYLTEQDKLFGFAKENLSKLNLVGLVILNTGRIERHGLTFKSDHIEKLIEIIRERRIVNIVSNKNNILLSSIKVYQAIEAMPEYKSGNDDYKYIYMTLSSVLNLQNKVIDSFSNQTNNLLVIECECNEKGVRDLYNNLHRVIRSNGNKKVVLITQQEIFLSENFKEDFSISGEYKEEIDENNKLTELTLATQEKLLKEQVTFQGKNLSLDTLLDTDDFNYLIGAKILSMLVTSEKIVIDKPACDLGDIKYYYIDRIFNCNTEIKIECFKELDTLDLFVLSNLKEREVSKLSQGEVVLKFEKNDQSVHKPTRFTILKDDDNVQEHLRQLYKDYPQYNTHWLKRHNDKFIWQQSNGDLTNLRKFIDQGNVSEYHADSITDIAARVVIVSAEPGMGKSTVVTKLAEMAKQIDPSLWVVRIALNDCTENLNKMSSCTNEGQAIDFLLTLMNLKTPLEKNLLERRINNSGRIAFLFDGFDEICPKYEEKTIQLLKILKCTKVEKLWITTRPHMKHKLEDNLSVLSHTLKPFSADDQKKFLVNFWSKELELSFETSDNHLNAYIERLINVWSSSIADKEVAFTGIPLQIRMLAEAFQDDVKKFYYSGRYEPGLPQKLNLIDLYDRFVDRKFDIYCEEKKRQNPTNIAVEDDNAVLRKIFIRNHQKAALYTLFEEDELRDLLSYDEYQDVCEFITKIRYGRERTGIIYLVINNNLSFIHRTFAEYFAANWLANNHGNPKVKDVYLRSILNKKNDVMRNFFDRMLAHGKHSENIQYEIHNAVLNEDKKKVHTLLLESRNSIDTPDKGGRTALHLAAAYGYNDLVEQLLNYRAQISKYDKVLLWSPLRYADKWNHWGVAELLLKKGSDGNDMVEAMHSIKTTHGGAECETLLHIAAAKNYFKIANLILNENVGVIKATDQHGNTPLHIAAAHNNLDIVKILIKYGADVDALANDGSTPLNRSSELDVYKFIVENGADVDAAPIGFERGIPLHFVSYLGKLDIARYLIEERHADITSKDKQGMTPLYVAAYSGHLDVVKYLVEEKSADINAVAKDGSTPLNCSGFSGKLDLVKYLVGKGAEINTMALDGSTPLYRSILSGKLEVVKFLFEKVADVYDNNKRIPLFWAANCEKWDIVFFFIEKGADVNATDENGNTVLHLAAYNGSRAIVECLFDKGADVNVENDVGELPLCVAASKNNWNIVKFLADKTVNVNAKCRNGNGVLHIAAARKKLDVVKLLVGKGANINLTNQSGGTPLDEAVFNGSWDVLNFIVEKCIDLFSADENGNSQIKTFATGGKWHVIKVLIENGLDVNTTDKFGYGLLHWYSSVGIMDAVKFLAENGSNINAMTKTGWTPLYIAASSGQLDVVKYLIEEKDADIKVNNYEGSHHLVHFASFLNWSAVKFLIEKGVDVSAKDKKGNTLLNALASRHDWDRVKFLLEKVTDVNDKDVEGRTPLYWAVNNEKLDIVKLLVKKGADVNVETKDGIRALDLAFHNGYLDIVKYFTDEIGMAINVKDLSDVDALHEAAKRRDWRMVEFLVEKGADGNSKDRDGNMLLHWAASYGDSHIVKFLVLKGASINGGVSENLLTQAVLYENWDIVEFLVENDADVNGMINGCNSLLHCAASSRNSHAIEFLIGKGANVNAKDESGKMPLHIAASHGNLNIIKLLVEKGADVDGKDNAGNAALDMADFNHELNAIKFLIENGADVNTKDRYGYMPLHKAAQKELWDLVKFLVEKGADVNEKDKDGKMALHWAVATGRRDVVKCLVDNCTDINANDNDGWTPLDIAAYNGNWGAVNMLVEIGCDVNSKDKYGCGLLHRAAKSGKCNIVQNLANKGADINSKDNDGNTPLNIAAYNGNWDIVLFLVKKRVDVNNKDKDGWPALHRVASFGNCELVKLLVDEGADFNGEDNNGWMPVHRAAFTGNREVIKFLLEKGVDVNTKDECGRGPLHRAAEGGNWDTVKFLTESGANIDTKDYNGNTPLSISASNGKLDVVKYLAGKGADINALDNYGNTPLHSSASSGKWEVVKYLVEKGVDVNSKDKNGFTPLYWAIASGVSNVITFLVEKGAEHLEWNKQHNTFDCTENIDVEK